VIDAVDLRLAERRGQLLVEGPGRRDVAAERLLDDDPAPGRFVRSRHGALVETGAAQALGNLAEQRRGDRHVEQRVPEGEAVQLRPQALVGRRIVEVAEDQGQVRVEPAALVGREPGLEEAAGVVEELGAEPHLLHAGPRHRHHARVVREQTAATEVDQRRHQLAAGEIAAGAEHDHDARRRRQHRRPFADGFFDRMPVLHMCPPPPA
jgi:hypothetical protein